MRKIARVLTLGMLVCGSGCGPGPNDAESASSNLCNTKGSGDCIPTPPPPPAAPGWLVALCYPSDLTTIVSSRDRTFYTKLFGTADSTGNAAAYWNTQSFSKSKPTFTVSSWTSTGHPLSWHQAQDRPTNIATCANAVLATVANKTYYNVISVYNGQLDEGSQATTFQGRTVPGVIIDAYSPETGIMHEMGHGFGLDHSFNDQGGEYGDLYDIMSAMNVYDYSGSYCVPPGGWFGCSMGPGLNMFTRWELGWLTAAQRKMFWPSTVTATQPSQTVTLRSRTETASASPQMLYVPATTTYMYTVEWSNANNYDQGFGGNNLLIHRINYGDGHTYLVTAAGGVQTAPGSSFTDAAAGLTIALTSVQGSPATATVKVTMGSASPLWSSAPTGTPPADPTKVTWVGFDALAGDTVPSNAFIAGFDANVGNLPACRVWFGGGEHIGKVVWNECSFPWGGAEHFEANTFQVLTAPGTTLTWVAGSNGSLPANALAAGFDQGSTLYVCRAQVAGNWTPGKFIFGACDVSWGGQEIFNSTYQVLTTN